MAHFTYTAQRGDGEVYKGAADAKDRFEVYAIVRQEGGKIIALEEEGSSKGWLDLTRYNISFSRITEYEKILFARNLGAMLSAGLSLARALSVMERQTKNQKMVQVVSQLAGDVRKGETLHASLAKFPRIIPKLFVAMVRAGEEGGDLAGSLSVVADQMERMYNLKKKIRSALVYPCIILIAIFGIGILMMIEVVPTLANTFKEMDAELPASTQFVIGLSDFLVTHSYMALGLFISALVGFTLALRSALGKRIFDLGILYIPMIGGMVREVNAARTSRTLASLLSSGVDMITALDIVGDVVQHTYFREVIKGAAQSVTRGEPLSASFIRREDLYPPFVGEMMAVGEETGQVAEMLKRLAVFYEDEVDRKTKDMSTIVEPFLMVLIGGAVGFFAISMITPIYSLSQNI